MIKTRNSSSPASAGGIANGVIARKKAQEKYYLNPNHCEHCGAVIMIKAGCKVQSARRKNTCGHTCAGKLIAIKAGKTLRKKMEKVTFTCELCGEEVTYTRKIVYDNYIRRYCVECRPKATVLARGCSLVDGDVTKGDLFSRGASWQSARSRIRQHAIRMFKESGRDRACVVCGYSAHIEIAHMKAVADFDGEATLSEINALTNLVALCPNHHWEYDHDLIDYL